jgi:hypothetical protein
MHVCGGVGVRGKYKLGHTRVWHGMQLRASLNIWNAREVEFGLAAQQVQSTGVRI